MKNYIIVLLCSLSVIFSSCAAYQSEKSPELVTQPKSIYISFESKSPLISLMDIDVYATTVQNQILKSLKARGIDAIFVHTRNTSLLSVSEQQQKINEFAPEVVMRIVQENILGSQIQHFDVKITTPNQEKILWRSPVYINTELVAAPKVLPKTIVYRLEKDGVFKKK